MKIVLVGPSHPLRGGIAHYTACLNEALRQNHKTKTLVISFSKLYPRLLFPGRTQRDESQVTLSTPALHILNPFRPKTWRLAVDRIREFDPQVVVFQWWHPFFGPCYSHILGRLGGSIRSVFLCHNVFPHETPRLPGASLAVRRLIGRSFGKVDGFLVHSHELASDVRRFNRKAPVEHIFHPVYDVFARTAKTTDQPTRSHNAKARMLFFGKVRPYKGLEVFMQALSQLKGRLDFEATIAGEFYIPKGPMQAIALQSGISDRLKWIDEYVDNERVEGLFRGTDLVVLPYLRATQSGVVPLAYAFNTPVLVSDVGGLSEVVRHGQTGYLVPAGDPARLAEMILHFFSEGEAPRMRANIETFKKTLSWGQVVEAIQSLVARLGLDSNRSPLYRSNLKGQCGGINGPD